jgi:hypothetical protein
LTCEDLTKIDSATCSKSTRVELLKLFSSPEFTIQHVHFSRGYDWIGLRDVKMIHLKFYSSTDFCSDLNTSKIESFSLRTGFNTDNELLSSNLLAFLNKCSKLTSFNVFGMRFDDEWFQKIDHNVLMQLTSISFDGHSIKLTDATVNFIALNCRNLANFSIGNEMSSDKHDEDIFKNFLLNCNNEKLTSLTLHSITKASEVVDESLMMAICLASRSLTRLDLHLRDSLMYFIFIPVLFQYCSQLQYVNLWCSNEISMKFIYKKSNEKVSRRVEVCGTKMCGSVLHESYPQVVSLFKSCFVDLTEVIFIQFCPITDGMILQVAESSPLLETFSACTCSGVFEIESFVKLFKKCPQITSFALQESWTPISAEDIVTLLSVPNQIKYLNVANHDLHLSTDHILTILKANLALTCLIFIAYQDQNIDREKVAEYLRECNREVEVHYVEEDKLYGDF